jgi:hypothetical protein
MATERTHNGNEAPFRGGTEPMRLEIERLVVKSRRPEYLLGGVGTQVIQDVTLHDGLALRVIGRGQRGPSPRLEAGTGVVANTSRHLREDQWKRFSNTIS